MKNLLIVIVLSFFSSASWAAESAKELLEGGFSAYAKHGANAAGNAWLKGSAMEETKQALAEMTSLSTVETYFGKYEGYELIKEFPMSKRSKSMMFVIHYELGAAYGLLQVYKTDKNEWITTHLSFHTRATEIWPSNMVFGE